LPAWWSTPRRGRPVVVAGALALSIAWYLIASTLFGQSGIHEITM
jgi:hypothetical protein